jgi:murein DD-endopeptidase MepM/ murein hydrolase activator NlpD
MRSGVVLILILFINGALAEPLYRLPWPEGRTFIFGQAPGGMITTHFTRGSRHAIDIPMPEGTPVLAARAGVVEAAGTSPIGGNVVRVRHDDGSVATYAHLASIEIQSGREIGVGELIGQSGNTGYSSGPHLHFGVARTVDGQDVSEPVTFYVGEPPLPFPARASLIVTADYSARAEPPRAPSEQRMVKWQPRTLSPEELALAWEGLAAWFAAGIAGIAWFWRFSRS